jgi:hypothetical protein
MPPDEPAIVQVPEDIRHVFGEIVPGTRMYRAEGPEGTSGPWFEAVCEIAGRCVSPGGAIMFAPVSRAAVHNRVREGKLTAFCFYVTKTSRGIFGKQRETRTLPLVYIPVSELKLWAAELEERMIRLGRITREEIEGDKPEWESTFWDWRAKWQAERIRKQGK